MRQVYAFTVLEAACCGVAVGIGLCVATAAVSGASSAPNNAHDVLNLANLHLTLVDFTAYSAARQDEMPNAGLPGMADSAWFYAELWDRPGAYSVYPSQEVAWPRVLQRALGGEVRPHWHSTFGPRWLPGDDPRAFSEQYARDHRPTRYRYSLTMLTRADAWVWPRREVFENWETTGRKWFAIVRDAQIATPASKGVLLHSDPSENEPRFWHIGFADGSATLKARDAAQPAAVPITSMGPNPMRRGIPVLHTVDGHLGADF